MSDPVPPQLVHFRLARGTREVFPIERPLALREEIRSAVEEGLGKVEVVGHAGAEQAIDLEDRIQIATAHVVVQFAAVLAQEMVFLVSEEIQVLAVQQVDEVAQRLLRQPVVHVDLLIMLALGVPQHPVGRVAVSVGDAQRLG